jgi:hypothetical protein
MIKQLLGSTLIITGLIYFVLSYKHTLTGYTSPQDIINQILVLHEDLQQFILNSYEYAQKTGYIDFELYKRFYMQFWSPLITILMGLGMYIKMDGTFKQRIKKLLSFTLPFILTLLIKIPIFI